MRDHHAVEQQSTHREAFECKSLPRSSQIEAIQHLKGKFAPVSSRSSSSGIQSTKRSEIKM